jgi:hypothetical protein
MSRTALLLGLAFSLSAAMSAAAQEAPSVGAAEVPPPAEPAAVDPLGDVLKPDDLAGRRGGESTVNVTSLQTLTATSANNSLNADNVDTGDVTFDAGALNGFSGVGNFTVNTGANSNVLGSLNVTIVTTAP